MNITFIEDDDRTRADGTLELAEARFHGFGCAKHAPGRSLPPAPALLHSAPDKSSRQRAQDACCGPASRSVVQVPPFDEGRSLRQTLEPSCSLGRQERRPGHSFAEPNYPPPCDFGGRLPPRPAVQGLFARECRGNIRGNVQIVYVVRIVQIRGRDGRSGRIGRI